ncbi:MAG: Re/Si-specific NAD(P)(+) transhydrogenase subunit alpha [Planctomycetota bacterium]|nr:MAG: Re/Si-specific NAD(P)(+) transhydrogenase subunit alpha [Planctomycetota bacterium]
MHIFVPRETDSSEPRAAATPDSVKRLCRTGAVVSIESGLGSHCHWSDAQYAKAGAEIAESRAAGFEKADIVLRVRKPEEESIGQMRKGAVHASFLDPFTQRDLIEKLAEAGITAISLELVPRTTLAQKLDALSSQHSVCGYYMVVLAAERLGKVIPMMSTPSGVIQPAHVLVIGAGVAGLQAIATARRLGARIEAFDTRPVVKEQVESLGAKFVEIDLGETGQTEGGYAKELTEEQKKKQREGLKHAISRADIVITTAKLFGRPAPKVVTRDMIEVMKPGSLIIDYAVDSGGNVEGSRPDEEVVIDGVRVLGFSNFPGKVAIDASRMYANNLAALVEMMIDPESKELRLDFDDEIIRGCVVTHDGQVVNETVKKAYAEA